jgi:hypothetical protein
MQTQFQTENENVRSLKTNGFTCPLNLMQIVSWLITMIVLLLVYTLVIPGFDTPVRIALNIIFTASLSMIFLLMMTGKFPIKIINLD